MESPRLEEVNIIKDVTKFIALGKIQKKQLKGKLKI